ncbi:integrator complex subunit 11-like [Uloborus diversus]|uniref:integrator complex subunit 11-like n=1 Tax=Uloborus diversus TaxID=327109 RepID=UPI00240A5323|nr:integrator complex subunit 11-like [Uloborus diversus]
MTTIKVTPLGAGQGVFPDFSFINQGNLTQHLSCVIISHFHLDHCGALPYMTEMVGYNGPIYMTMPTKAICPILLEDYRRITVDKKGETNFFTSTMVKDCMKKVTTVGLHETVQVDDEMEIKAYYAGHVLGAAMFLIRVGSQSVVYTGDFNTTPDRHLGAAWIDKCRPDLLITESTYGTTIRDSKRCRERDFLTKVHDCVERGGKVLIPVFALGRAQEMCILLETYWERMNLKIPIYFAVGLTEKATTFYKMFITWTNQKIKQTFVHRNMFDFKHIKPFDRAYIDNPGPMVVFATPGMLHSGLSVQIFRKWAPNENNMLIMPGYCVAGTVGHKVISGAKKIEFENRQIVEVKMSVQYMSFSAHADAKGIMQLIQHCEPSKVMLVHGEASKMEFLKKKITQELGKECLMPANGETVSFETPITVPVDVSLDLLKKQIYSRDANGIGGLKRKSILHGMLVMNNNKIRLMEPEEAMQEVGVVPHQVRFTSTLRIEDPTGAPASRLTDVIFSKIKSLLENHNVQLAPDCSITVASVLIKVDVGEDDTKSICVSWGYQDEELGKFLLPAIKKWSSETKG